MAKTKAEMAEELADAGKEVNPDDHTAAELEEMLEKTDDPVEALRTPGGITRRKVNRGSTRRINRALENVDKALAEFRDEIDRQVFVTDDEGNRTGPAPLVEVVDSFRQHLPGAVAEFTTPIVAAPEPAHE